MLDRGGRSLSQMLGSAIQLGRNAVDNQMRQEQSFLTEQRREINLNERRAENIIASLERDRQFDESQRRFDLKFNQDEEFQQDRLEQAGLDRDIRRRQVEGGLELGRERMGLERERMQEGRAARLFGQNLEGQEEARRQEEFRLRKRQAEAEINQLESGNREQQSFFDEFSRATPSQRTELLNRRGFGLGFDATTLRSLVAQSDIGVTQDQKSRIEQLSPADRSSAEGLSKAIEDLEIKLRMGRKGALGEAISLSPEEKKGVEAELQDAKTKLDVLLQGDAGTASGLLDRARRKTSQ